MHILLEQSEPYKRRLTLPTAKAGGTSNNIDFLDMRSIPRILNSRNVSIIAYWHRFFPQSWALLYPNTLNFQDAIPAATGTASFYIYNHKQEAEQ